MEDANETAVTGGRIKAMAYIQERECSVEDFKKRHMSLHEITELPCRGSERNSVRLVCDCAYYWNCGTYCSHVVAIYHKKGIINIYQLMSSLKPVRKRGRPTTREKALERDKDVLSDKLDDRPGDMRKMPIRHPVHLNSMIYLQLSDEARRRDCVECPFS